MQEHFRGKILRRMMTEEDFKAFCRSYEEFKLVNVGRREVTSKTKSALEKIKQWSF